MKLAALAGTLLSGLFSFSQTIELEEIAGGFTAPTEIVNAGDSRLFVVEQGGLIKVLNADGTTNATPFLDVSSLITTAGAEQGLTGMAFHPDYAENGLFFISYIDVNGDSKFAKYSVSENPEIADASSAEVILSVDQPAAVHNSGCIRFGLDGYLYIAIGDGGEWEDPNNHAQNLNLLLGKILRIDVDNGSPYSIPADNPYVGTEGADEIWARGLRNPWKFSLDNNGNIWIADVGQNTVEEINKANASVGGLNYGWRCYEGELEFNTNGCTGPDDITWPYAEYNHVDEETGFFLGCSITGGYVYEGIYFTDWQNTYFFTDYCNGRIGTINSNGDVTYTTAFDGNNFTTFGKGYNGELYLAGGSSGKIFHLKDPNVSTENFEKNFATIYPNPASNKLNVAMQANDALLAIYDFSGKLLLEKQLKSTEEQVDITSLQSGVYIVKISNSGNDNYEKLIVI